MLLQESLLDAFTTDIGGVDFDADSKRGQSLPKQVSYLCTNVKCTVCYAKNFIEMLLSNFTAFLAPFL
jgi:hypothetical protein